MKRSQSSASPASDYSNFEKRSKTSSNFETPVIYIKNDLDAFREQPPVHSFDLAENYQTKPLPDSDTQNEITRVFDRLLPIEYQSWETSIVSRSSMVYPLKTNETGWIPTRQCRTMAAYQKEILGEIGAYNLGTEPLPSQGHKVDFIENIRFDDRGHALNWYSIFPFTDTVILKNIMDNPNFQSDLNWKPTHAHPQPDLTITELPLEPPVFSVRKEKPTTHSNVTSTKPNKESRLHRTRNVLARAGLIGVLPDEPVEYHRDKPKDNPRKKSVHFWNLSNDFAYDLNSDHDFLSKRRMNSSQNFDLIYSPTFRTIDELRYFHRPFLELPTVQHSWTPFQTSDSSPNSNLPIRAKADLTSRCGELILFEYSEQYPALLNEIGMFSKIRTYLRPQHFKADTSSHRVDHGELIYTHASPFLWSLPRGLNIQTIENNMFIAPIYRQIPLRKDFLVIFNRQSGFSIRTIENIYIIGQQCPLIEVPIPQSKRVNLLQRDLLQIYIYRLFLQSQETPRRIRIDDIKRVFPRLAESSIRKRLKTSADFRRTAEDEIRDLIKPEYCCAYASMTAAEQRLKDTGICDKYHLDSDNNDDEQLVHSPELNDEILQAPWNTTRAYLGALKGKCSMQVFGIGAKNIHKTKINDDFKHLRRAVTGTDADLRRLQLKDARKLLLKFHISEKIIQSLTRWEIVDLVRTLSTQQAKEGLAGGMVKYARGAKHLQAQQFEKYKENCQKQFELQNRLFTCIDEQSTDENTSDEDAQLLDEMSQTLENLLRENLTNEHGKMLHITRTYIDSEGRSYQREEFIRNNDSLIQAYRKIRQTKPEKFIKSYYALDDNEREVLKRERRRLQEQLRRVKRNEARYNQYEKQQMLLQIQQQNLALIQSTQTCLPSPSPITLKRSTSILSDLQLSLSENDDNDFSSSSDTNF